MGHNRVDLVSIIIPAFNEEESLKELYERTEAIMNEISQPYEFIIIDDGSTDKTYQVVEALRMEHKNIASVHLHRNRGKSLALMQGFDIARGEIAITMDADLQDRPENIPLFLEEISKGHDLVCGWRKHRKDESSRRYLSKIFNFLIVMIFKCKVHDINCGYKAYHKSFFKLLNLRGDWHRIIPVLATGRGLTVSEIEIPHDERKYGVSKYNLFRHRGLFDIILIGNDILQFRPFHLLCELAFFFWVAGFIAFFAWLTFTSGIDVMSFLTRFFSGILMLFSGLSFLVGTILPLLGFYLEIDSSRYQDKNWRETLRKNSFMIKD